MTFVHVIAFDPGETIGWCVMGVDHTCLTDVNTWMLHEAIRAHGVWQWGQLDAKALGSPEAGSGAYKGHDSLNFVGENHAVNWMLYKCNNELPDAAVLLEKFVLDPAKASGKFSLISPVRIISAFSFGMWVAESEMPGNFHRFYLINRGDPKRTCTNERLKHWGFGSVLSHVDRHAADATRIAYYFLRDCRGNSLKAQEARWRAWPHIFADPMAGERRMQTALTRNLGERI